MRIRRTTDIVFIVHCVLCLAAVRSTSITNDGKVNECKVDTNGDNNCPLWTSRDNQSHCVCIDHTYPFVQCAKIGNVSEAFMLVGNCITRSNNQTFVAGCPYYDHHQALILYIPVPRNVLQISQMCTQFKRTGQYCGECEKEFSPSVYSYDLSCVKCSADDYYRKWGKYLAITLLPTTVFYFVVLIFRFRATSPQLNAYIMLCQLIASPYTLREFAKRDRLYDNTQISTRYLSGFFSSFLSIWNLDYFRLIYTPFCLHPHASMLQVLSLDYITALYPFVLIIFTYILVTLHYHGCPLVVWLWRPFRKCFARLRRQWDIHNSLGDAFATFILLSYVKILSVSIDILTFSIPVDECGNRQPAVPYYDGSVKYFGKEHLPFAVLAIVMLLVFTVFPILLLLMFPCRCFQKFLNKFHINSPALHMFMNIFQGCFKDGTEGTKDCRYFAAFYLMIRVIFFCELAVLGYSQMYVCTISLLLMSILFFLYFPHKSPLFNKVDVIFIVLLVVFEMTELHVKSFDLPLVQNVEGVFYLIPIVLLMYPVCLVLYISYKKSRRFQAIILHVKMFFSRHLSRQPPAVNIPPVLNEASPLLPK